MLFRWTLILLQFAWLNVLMPGHIRGSVTMAPGEAAPPSSDHCCSRERPSEDRDGKPTDQDRASCAICFFAARMTVPPVVDLTPPALGLAEVRPVEISRSFIVSPPRPTHDSRGPPVA